MKNESFIDLIQQAGQMLLDRHPDEQKLIYEISILDDDARSAIILAYRMLMEKNE